MMARILLKATSLLLLCMLSFSLKAQLVANFTANQISGCAPLVTHFTDQSTNNATQWKWDLGNGTVSYLQNPSATYFSPGTYTIKLVSSTSNRSDTIIKSQFISIFAQPAVNFTSTATSGCYPWTVNFTDKSIAGAGAINLWQWDLGDGASSTLQNPTHTYTSSGDYNLTLRVRNSNGCITTFSKTAYVHINTGVTASFTNNAPNNCSFPSIITFQNLSIGVGALAYKWDFGDNTISSETNPSHSYNATGSYTVKLIVVNANGCTDTITKPDIIVIRKVAANFSVPNSICILKPFLITNTSVPAPLSSKWTFSDGHSDTALQSLKTFTSPGNYTIKLVALFGGCSDSITKSVVVINKPSAVFTANNYVACAVPFTVNFTSQPSNATSWQWDFGDGSTSASQNPAHTYTDTGNYSVQLITFNVNGCTDTLKQINSIKIQKPKISFDNLPDSGCVPFTKYFSSTITSIDKVVSYLWDFGDGNTSTLQNPTHNYNTAGAYNISLSVTTAGGCTETSVIKRGVVANTKPVANFSATPVNTCAHSAIFFTDLSKGTVTGWLWTFGDGGSSTSQNPNHFYGDTGTFTVQLIVNNGGCTDTIKFNNYIHINAPIASFLVPNDCSNPFQKTFINQSVGADVWSWNFGDSTTSTQLNPVHTFSGNGTYMISLSVKNNASGCDFIYKAPIRVLSVKANFTTSDSSICRGKIINFITKIDSLKMAYINWNFGDGASVSSLQDTTPHLYKYAGNYSVRLIIANQLGCSDTLIKPLNIRINGPAAKFIASVPGSCLNNAIVFNDLSATDNVNPITNYTWNFGDGTIQTLTAPFQHTYSVAGNYNVKLLITDKIGCSDSFSIPTAIIISKPIASFSSMDTLTCPAMQVHFTNQSTGPNLTYFWRFGDGFTSSLQLPIHNYSIEGVYSVTLIITDQYGCMDSSTRQKYIKIVMPKADFKLSDSLSSCPPLIVQFTNLSINAVKVNWNFGDGTATQTDNPSHFYNYPGTYLVVLTITGPGGCISTKQSDIIIKGPTGTFTYNPLISCTPILERFTAKTSEAVSLIWDFNDGSTLNTTDTFVTHPYTYLGSYLPKIILTDKGGCQVAILGLDTIVVYGAHANLNFLNKAVCDSGLISFSDSSFSNDLITKYQWYFGDGKSSTDKNPEHSFAVNGLYYPKLKVTTSLGCVDSTSSIVPVKVVSSPHIDILPGANGCTPLSMNLQGLVTAADTASLSWNWDFANGSSSSLKNPSLQSFTTAGNYNISLAVTNSSGCKSAASKSITAYPIPVVNAGKDAFLCYKTAINLQATGADYYNWSPATGLDCPTCFNPRAMPDSNTNYILKGTTTHGCVAWDSINVSVKYPFKIANSKQDTLCKGQTRKLFVTGGYAYTWYPAAGLNNSTIATPIAQPDVTTDYMVIAKDEVGCFSDTGHVFIKVYPIPVVDAGVDKKINVGQSFELMPTVSEDVTSVLWTPTNAIVSSNYPAITIKPNTTTDYTVSVKNAGGCSSQDRITVYVICDGTNVFIPNTFTPNGDGVNDVFYPRGSGLFKIKSFRVFNRWGEIVFERTNFNANDPSAGWDGTYKGAKLNPDVYVYTIEIVCSNNNLLIYSGNIALLQ